MKYFSIILLNYILHAQSGFDIAKMMDDKLIPKDLSNKTTMLLTNSKNKIRESSMISKSIDGNKKQIIWFLNPKDDRGVSFLKIEHEDKNDEMRMWLPAFKKVRRISSKKKGDAFMGSDLSYEDLSSRNLNEHDYNRLEDALIDGKGYYVLEVIPKKEVKSSYSKHISWIQKETLSVLKEKSFDNKGILKKEKDFEYQKIESYYIVSRVFVKDVQSNHSTEITFSDILIDSGIESNLFHEKNLKRIPRI